MTDHEYEPGEIEAFGNYIESSKGNFPIPENAKLLKRENMKAREYSVFQKYWNILCEFKNALDENPLNAETVDDLLKRVNVEKQKTDYDLDFRAWLGNLLGILASDILYVTEILEEPEDDSDVQIAEIKQRLAEHYEKINFKI